MKNNTSTSYISSSNSNQSSVGRVAGDGSDINKAGFYFRDSSFLIDEHLNFIVTEGGAKFILDFFGKQNHRC